MVANVATCPLTTESQTRQVACLVGRGTQAWVQVHLTHAMFTSNCPSAGNAIKGGGELRSCPVRMGGALGGARCPEGRVCGGAQTGCREGALQVDNPWDGVAVEGISDTSQGAAAHALEKQQKDM